jgi:hypothetical protein
VLEDGVYTLPPIALFTPDPIEVVMLEGEEPASDEFGVHGPVIAYLQPGVTRVVAFDGDTQASALLSLYDSLRPEDPNREKISVMPVSIEFHFGTDISWARQSFHDRNVYGVRVNTSLAIGMDSRDPLVDVMRHVEATVPAIRGRISTTKRQLGAKDTELFTASAMRQFVATLHDGLGGLQKKGPVVLGEGELDTLKTNATIWMTALYSVLKSQFADRANAIPSAPAVVAALGAVGHDVFYRRTLAKDDMLRRIAAINWSKGSHWMGIAGKATGSGNLSIGGPKEVSGHIYTAITDASCEKGVSVTAARAA